MASSIRSLTLIALVLSSARASYKFKIEVQSYTNPSSRNAYGQCCSVADQAVDDCRSECSNAFLFCLRAGGYPHNLQDCPLGTWWTKQVRGDVISFVTGEDIDSGVSNPLVLSEESWTGAVQVYIRVDNKRGLSNVDLVDTIFTDVVLEPNSSLPMMTYRGDYGNANFELGFRVTCSENYYGKNCTAYCAPGNARYRCTAQGIACNAGYQNPSTNCTECVPADGCSHTGGYCTLPGECLCRPGFSGSLCATSSADPCTQQYGFPCSDETKCVNTEDGSYRCACPPGYHGYHCQERSNPCNPNPCLNAGSCYTNAGSYTCVCSSGYKGHNCETECLYFASGCATNTSDTQSYTAGATLGTSNIVLGLFLCLSVVVVFVLSAVVAIIVWRRRKDTGDSEAVPVPQHKPEIGSAENPVYDEVPLENTGVRSAAGTHQRPQSYTNKNNISDAYETVDDQSAVIIHV